MELIDDDSLRSVDNERSPVGHAGNRTEVDLLFRNGVKFASVSVFINVIRSQSRLDFQRKLISRTSELAFIHIVLRLSDGIT